MTKLAKRIVLPLFLIVCCAFLCLAQSGPKTTQEVYFKADAREVIQPGSLPADKVSATSIGDVLTLLFDGSRLSLQAESDPLAATWVGTIRIPTGATAKAAYVQHVRGSVIKTKETKVTLILSLGGRTFVKEYPYGTKSTGDIILKYTSPVLPKSALSYVATVVVSVERRDSKSAVMVDIDSLDVEAKSGTHKKK